jgi:serine protease inhibitor
MATTSGRRGLVLLLAAAVAVVASAVALNAHRGGGGGADRFVAAADVQPIVDGAADHRVERAAAERADRRRANIFASGAVQKHASHTVSPYSEQGDAGDCTALARDVGLATHGFGLRALHAALKQRRAAQEKPGPLFLSPASLVMAMGVLMQGASDSEAAAIGAMLGLAGGHPVHGRKGGGGGDTVGDASGHWARCLGRGVQGTQRDGAATALGDMAAYLAVGEDNDVAESANESDNASNSPKHAAAAKRGGLVSIANAVWIGAGAQLEPRFEEAMQDHFAGEVHETRFGTSAATRDIDAWVASRTRGMIPSLGATFPASVRAVITNAVYFDVSWERAFEPSRTIDDQFARGWGPGGERGGKLELVDAKFLCAEGKFHYGESPLFTAVAIPYTATATATTADGVSSAGPVYEALFVLPRKIGAELDVVAELAANPDDLVAFRDGLRLRKGHVEIPRVRGMETTLEMTRVLGAIGFDPSSARLDGIVRGDRVRVSEVLHKTVLDVTEEGTKAAAVTGITMRALVRPAIPIDPPFRFIAHQPVILIIRDVRTAAALFTGIVTL